MRKRRSTLSESRWRVRSSSATTHRLALVLKRVGGALARRHNRPQVLPAHLRRRTEKTTSAPPRQPGQAMEVLLSRHKGTRLLGLLPTGFRGRPEQLLDRARPWYIMLANKKWYRNLIVARTIADTLGAMNPQYPPAEEGLEKVTIPD